MKAKITKRLVDRIEADPARDVLVWDTDVAGFGLRVTRGGVKATCSSTRSTAATGA